MLRRFRGFIHVALCVVAASAASLAIPLFGSRPPSLDAAVGQFLSETGIPGGVLAFGHPGQAPDVRAYGLSDALTGARMLRDSRLKIASLSKPITSEAVLALIQPGQLSLDSRLADLHPSAAAAADPRVGKITLRHLLQHSGGWDRGETLDPFFMSEGRVSALTGAPASQIENCSPLADALLGQPLQFDPGSRYAYSNVGYCWLGRIITARRGTSYESAVHALLPETTEMTLEVSSLTVRHHIQGTDGSYLTQQPRVLAAAGGWIATAARYFQFASRPIDPRVLDRPHYASGSQYYGLGWRIWTMPNGVILTHFGAMPGVFSVVIKKQNGPIFVALFNGRPADDDAAFRSLLKVFSQHVD